MGNGLEPGTGAGWLVEVNRPALPPAYTLAARSVLDGVQQAWCVMTQDVRPFDSCIPMP